MSIETLLVGAGCFWGVQQRFSHIHGVEKVLAGYAGGKTESPSYEAVCQGDSMHAEVVQIEFDNKVITREQLLHLFFRMHNATTLNRQGADTGTQYRSVIFYDNDEERVLAKNVIEEEQKNISAPIVTTIEPMATFWKAEEYHQDYFEKRGVNSGCH